MTSEGDEYYVRFHESGYKLGLHEGIHFSSLRSLLHHMTAVEAVTFVPRYLPTLQEFARDILAGMMDKFQGVEKDMTIPNRLKCYIDKARHKYNGDN